MVDRPAREALLMRPPLAFGPALFGLVLIGACTALGGLLAGDDGLRVADRALFALLEALAVAFPMLLVMSNFAGLRLTPATLMSGGAIALGVAGLVSVLMVPLLVFLSLCAGAGSPATVLRTVLVPVVALSAVVGVLSRILRSADSGQKARAVVWGFAFLATATLLARLQVSRWL